MEKVKREGTAIKVNSAEGIKVVEGVKTAHRDGRGGIWWTKRNSGSSLTSWLSTGFHSGLGASAQTWVTFNNTKFKEDERDDFTDLSSLPSSKCTDLHHIRPLLVIDDSTEQLVYGRVKRSSSAVGSMILPSPSTKSSNIVLAIPSRPTRTKHLLQPGFLKDVVAVPPTPSILTPLLIHAVLDVSLGS